MTPAEAFALEGDEVLERLGLDERTRGLIAAAAPPPPPPAPAAKVPMVRQLRRIMAAERAERWDGQWDVWRCIGWAELTRRWESHTAAARGDS